jgi:aspartate oxidase
LTDLKQCQKERIAEVVALEQKLNVYEEKIRHMKQTFKRELEEKDRDIEIKCNELENIMEEYLSLKQEKDTLHREICSYRVMLESEEHRLNIPKASVNENLVQCESGYFESSQLQNTQNFKKRRHSGVQDSSVSGSTN